MENLSKNALALLQMHQDGGSLQVDERNPETLPGCSIEETRAAYQELVAAELAIPKHTFAHGRNSRYRLTEAGVIHDSSRHASLEGSLAPHH